MNKNQKPKLWLDNSAFYGPVSGGVSLVWFELITRLIRDNKFSLRFVDAYSKNNKHRRMLNLEGYETQKDPFIKITQYLPVYTKEQERFIFHTPYYRYCLNPNAINITTVHDFTYEYYRKGLAKLVHCYQKYNAIRHSDYIVCISENTKKDLLKFLPDIDENKIRVIYNGVSDDYSVLDKSTSDPDLPFEAGTYLVFVGSRTSYKNFDFIKDKIVNTGLNLVIVGNCLSDIEEQDLLKYLPKERYCCTGFLPNNQLNIIYNYAAALVYPSSYEGFGIPIIEAQKAGCPVIAYNSSSIPEVIGDTPLLMNELSEKEFYEKIELLKLDDVRKSVIEAGIINASRFSWEKMFNEYTCLYESILK